MRHTSRWRDHELKYVGKGKAIQGRIPIHVFRCDVCGTEHWISIKDKEKARLSLLKGCPGYKK